MSRCHRTGRVDHGTVFLRGPRSGEPMCPPVPGDLQARPFRAEKLTSPYPRNSLSGLIAQKTQKVLKAENWT